MHPTIFALKRAYQSSRNVLELGLQGSGLTVAQVEIIKLLLEPGATLEQRALQAALGITSATLTRLLAGMQRKSLIVRAVHPTDARGKVVRLTPKARKLYDAMMAANEHNFTARLLRGFSARETLTLTKLLGRLADNMTADNMTESNEEN
jgi:DNA-binding MarR family transcriptional regulator